MCFRKKIYLEIFRIRMKKAKLYLVDVEPIIISMDTIREEETEMNKEDIMKRICQNEIYDIIGTVIEIEKN